MIARLLLLLILVPLADLILLLLVSKAVGFWATLSLVIFSGILGVVLCRWQLRSLASRASQVQQVAEAPGRFLSDGLLIFIGAALLVTPGLITDVLGFSLLIPFSRRWHQRRLFAWLVGRGEAIVVASGYAQQGPTVVEGQVLHRETDETGR